MTKTVPLTTNAKVVLYLSHNKERYPFMQAWYQRKIEQFSEQYQSLIMSGAIKEAMATMVEMNNYKLMLAQCKH